jgi:hypothetical protein
MRRHWILAAVALTLASTAWADPPTAQDAAPTPPLEKVVDGSVLVPAPGGDLEVDGAPFPLHSAEPAPPPPGSCFLIYGGGYLLTPTFQTDPAFVRTSANAVQQVDFSHHMSYAPMAGLGFTGKSNWGLRTRWFSFSQTGTEGAVSAPGETLNAASPLAAGSAPQAGAILANSNLRLNSWDLEGTYLVRYSQWTLLLGSGVRYVHISDDYSSLLSAVNGTKTYAGTGHNFTGFGPTISADGRIPFGEGRLALYGNTHFSLLFGDSHESYFAQNVAGVTTSAQSEMRVLPIGEIEVGLEYSHALHRARFFAQAGFVGQAWWGAGNASNVDPLAGTTASGSNFGLYGIAFRAGLNF